MSNNKQAQLIKGYWVVETNRWNADIYTQEQAEVYANTLVNCTNCINCSYCSNCHDCSYCNYCSSCHDCIYCSSCISCHDCSSCHECSSCHDCRYCRNCNDCIFCSDCISCSYFKENPERIISPKIGSRHKHTTYYWTKDHEQIVCGCFKGTLEDFEKAVEKKHGDNQHGIDYKNWIQKVKLYKNK
jgi:hypothetical protein